MKLFKLWGNFYCQVLIIEIKCPSIKTRFRWRVIWSKQKGFLLTCSTRALMRGFRCFPSFLIQRLACCPAFSIPFATTSPISIQQFAVSSSGFGRPFRTWLAPGFASSQSLSSRFGSAATTCCALSLSTWVSRSSWPPAFSWEHSFRFTVSRSICPQRQWFS